MRGTTLRRVLLLTVAVLLATVAPAFADPPGPTNFRTELGRLQPPVEGVEAEIIGGDAFLQLRVDGHEVVVPGYDGEERYLRFDANGEVFENRNSVAYWQNQARYGGEVPSDVGPQVPPDWVRVSTDGSYAWHDHRIHFMSPLTLPNLATEDGTSQQVDPDGGTQLTTVFSEPIPIVVDGQEVGIPGDLFYLPDASPLPALLVGVVALAGVVALGRRTPAISVLVGLVVASLAALAVSLPQVVGLAPGVTAQPLQAVLPLVALGATVALWAVRQRTTFGLVVAAGGALPLLVWVVTNAGALTAPVVPPDVVPAIGVRLVLGLVAGAAVGAIVAAVHDLLTSGALDLEAPAATDA